MEELHKLTIEALVDLLSIKTEAYLHMHIEGSASDEEFDKCRLYLRALQKEIKSREKNPAEHLEE